ncbi:unnamed protein product, partial [Mesorhabditis belari]|uniref:Potassium channel domain-containing protein n=1 Tax=Mesorhabditis belari TaxID=2138241 RepID=A0AAF3EA22_9BILA
MYAQLWDRHLLSPPRSPRFQRVHKRSYDVRGRARPSGTMTVPAGYQRVDSDPTISDHPNHNCNEGVSYQDGPPAYMDVESGDDELGELEREELADRLGDIPSTFMRRARRNQQSDFYSSAVFDSMASRHNSDNWETTHLLSCSQHTHTSAHDEGDEEDSKDEEEDEEEERGGIKKYAKLILPHVGLVVLTCIYTTLGALLFWNCEQPYEMSTKREQLNEIYARQDEFVESLVRMAALNRTSRADWELAAREHMHTLSDQLFTAFEKYFLTSHEVRHNATSEIWTFSTSLFFAVTVVTTIGYGNPVPITMMGRIGCIVFSLLGIPLTLVTIADLGKFLSENLIWLYTNYQKLKTYLCRRHDHRKDRNDHVCQHCQSRGLGPNVHFLEGPRIPAVLVLVILLLYTALGGVLMRALENWTFFTAFYWSFITMTTVGFGDLMPKRDEYMYIILLYIILGLAITTMCIDLVGVQYIRKIHYFGRKIQDARSALAVVGGKVVLVSELYANLMQKRARQNAREAYIIENMYISKHIIPFIPTDIRWIRYIDQPPGSRSPSTGSISELHSCRFCHSRYHSTTQ